MVRDFPDVTDETETVTQFLQVAAVGKGKTKRARAYIRPIALRYVEGHQQLQMEIQQSRRQSGGPTTVETTPTTDPTTPSELEVEAVETSDVFVDAHWTTALSEIQVQEVDGTWRDVTVFRNK